MFICNMVSTKVFWHDDPPDNLSCRWTINMWVNRCKVVLPNGGISISPKKKMRNRVRLEVCMATTCMMKLMGFAQNSLHYIHTCITTCGMLMKRRQTLVRCWKGMWLKARYFVRTYYLIFYLKTQKKQNFKVLLAFQSKWNFLFFMAIFSFLAFKSNLCHIIWTWKIRQKYPPLFRGWGWFLLWKQTWLTKIIIL